MSNVLSTEKREQVVALGRLGWPLRRIEQTTGVRRETASAYLRAAGIPIRPPGSWGRRPAKPANEVTTDPEAENPVSAESSAPPPSPPSGSSCEPYRETIQQALERGRNAMAIWQDLVTDHGFVGSYESVKRFVRKLRGVRSPEAVGIIQTGAGEEAQVDYGTGPMVRDPKTGKYRRTRLFVMTLGYSRKSVRLLTFKSSSRIWAQLHETAFRKTGENYWVIAPPSQPCWTGCSITATSSNAALGVGGLKRACRVQSQRGRTTPSRAIPVARF